MAQPRNQKARHSNLKKQSARPAASRVISDTRNPLPYILLCIALTILVFSNTLQNEFCWDDGGYIVENNIIKDISTKQGLKTVLTQDYGGNYHPLTALVNALEYKYFKLDPRPYHIINLLFHALNVFLVFIFVRKLTSSIEASTIAALLFAIHPMRVESVAWIAELKDVMYTFFFILSLLAYLQYRKKGNSLRYLLLSLVLFFLSGASKSAAVCLPFVLFLLDYYEGRKFNSRYLAEKIPFFVVALYWGIKALDSQKNVGAVINLDNLFTIADRFFLVSYAIVFYIVKIVSPFNLTIAHIYPTKINGSLPTEYLLAPIGLAIFIGVLVYALVKKNKWSKDIVFALLFYIVTVALVLQIIPVGKTVVSERYSYMPYLGIFLLIAKFISQFSISNKPGPWKLKLLPTISIGILIIGFSILTWSRNKVWKNDESIFTDVIKKNPNVDFAYNNRGNIKFKRDEYTAALADYQKAVELNPNYTDAIYSRGVCREKMNNLQGALEDYNTTIKQKNNYAYAYNNRGNVRKKLGDTNGALEDYNKALEISPDYADVYFNRATLKDMLKDYRGSLADYTEFLKRRNDFFMGFFNRGNAKYFLGDYKGAIEDFSITLQMNPSYPEALFNRGYCKISTGDTKSACDDFKRALQIGLPKAAGMIEKYCK